jgi:outer membrane protein assembly factor BamB
LKTVLRSESKRHSAGIILNDTVRGKLVAMPWFGDFGILCYGVDGEERWRVPLGAGYSGPAVANGRVYVLDRPTAEADATNASMIHIFVGPKP